jgi:hypothetical protein
MSGLWYGSDFQIPIRVIRKSVVKKSSSPLGGSNSSFPKNPHSAFLSDLSGFAVNLE